MTETTGTIYLVDDDDEARFRHEQWLSEAGFRVAAFGDTGPFLDQYSTEGPSCVFCEYELPGMRALELLRILQAKELEPTFSVLTRLNTVPLAVQALKVGAFDFLVKPMDGDRLVGEVRAALREDVRRRRARGYRNEIADRHVRLTRREREVMKLMVSGRASKEIAAYLELSPRTVESHRARVMQKMEASSLPELVRHSLLMQSTCCNQILKAIAEVDPIQQQTALT